MAEDLVYKIRLELQQLRQSANDAVQLFEGIQAAAAQRGNFVLFNEMTDGIERLKRVVSTGLPDPFLAIKRALKELPGETNKALADIESQFASARQSVEREFADALQAVDAKARQVERRFAAAEAKAGTDRGVVDSDFQAGESRVATARAKAEEAYADRVGRFALDRDRAEKDLEKKLTALAAKRVAAEEAVVKATVKTEAAAAKRIAAVEAAAAKQFDVGESFPPGPPDVHEKALAARTKQIEEKSAEVALEAAEEVARARAVANRNLAAIGDEEVAARDTAAKRIAKSDADAAKAAETHAANIAALDAQREQNEARRVQDQARVDAALADARARHAADSAKIEEERAALPGGRDTDLGDLGEAEVAARARLGRERVAVEQRLIRDLNDVVAAMSASQIETRLLQIAKVKESVERGFRQAPEVAERLSAEEGALESALPGRAAEEQKAVNEALKQRLEMMRQFPDIYAEELDRLESIARAEELLASIKEGNTQEAARSARAAGLDREREQAIRQREVLRARAVELGGNEGRKIEGRLAAAQTRNLATARELAKVQDRINRNERERTAELTAQEALQLAAFKTALATAASPERRQQLVDEFQGFQQGLPPGEMAQASQDALELAAAQQASAAAAEELKAAWADMARLMARFQLDGPEGQLTEFIESLERLQKLLRENPTAALNEAIPGIAAAVPELIGFQDRDVALRDALADGTGFVQETVDLERERLRLVGESAAILLKGMTSPEDTARISAIVDELTNLNTLLSVGEARELGGRQTNAIASRIRGRIAAAGDVEDAVVLRPFADGDREVAELAANAGSFLERTLTAVTADFQRRFITTLQFAFSAAVIYGSQRLAKELIKAAIDVERTFADIETAFEFDIAGGRANPDFARQIEQIRRDVLGVADEFNVLPEVANEAAFVMVSRFKDSANAMKAFRAQVLATKISTIDQAEVLRALTAVAEGFAPKISAVNDGLDLQGRLLRREAESARLYAEALDYAVRIQQTWGVQVEDTLEGTARSAEVFGQLGFSIEETSALVAGVSFALGQTGVNVAERLNRSFGQITNPEVRDSLIDLANATDGFNLSLSSFESGSKALGIIAAQIDALQQVNPAAVSQIFDIIGQRREREVVAAAFGTADIQRDMINGLADAAGAAEARFEVLNRTTAELIADIATGFQELAQNLERLGILSPLKVGLEIVSKFLKLLNSITTVLLDGLGLLGRWGHTIASWVTAILSAVSAMKLLQVAMHGSPLLAAGAGALSQARNPAVGAGGVTTTVLSSGLGGLFAGFIRDFRSLLTASKGGAGVKNLLDQPLRLGGVTIPVVSLGGKMTSLGSKVAGVAKGLGSFVVGLFSSKLALAALAVAAVFAVLKLRELPGKLNDALKEVAGAQRQADFEIPQGDLSNNEVKLQRAERALELQVAALEALPKVSFSERIGGALSKFYDSIGIDAQTIENFADFGGVGKQPPGQRAEWLHDVRVKIDLYIEAQRQSVLDLAIAVGEEVLARADEVFSPDNRKGRGSRGGGPEARVSFLRSSARSVLEQLGNLDLDDPEDAEVAQSLRVQLEQYLSEISSIVEAELTKFSVSLKAVQEAVSQAEFEFDLGIISRPDFEGALGEQLKLVQSTLAQAEAQGIDEETIRALKDEERSLIRAINDSMTAGIDDALELIESHTEGLDSLRETVVMFRRRGSQLLQALIAAAKAGDELEVRRLWAQILDNADRLNDTLSNLAIGTADAAVRLAQARLGAAKTVPQASAASADLVATLRNQIDVYKAQQNADAETLQLMEFEIDQVIKDAEARRSDEAFAVKVETIRKNLPVRSDVAEFRIIAAELDHARDQFSRGLIDESALMAAINAGREGVLRAAEYAAAQYRAQVLLAAGTRDQLANLAAQLKAFTLEMEITAEAHGLDSPQYLDAQLALQQLETQFGDAALQLADFQRRLGSDLTDPFEQATLDLVAVLQQLEIPDLGDLERTQLEVERKNAEASRERERFNAELFNLRFASERGELGTSQYVSSLRSLRDEVDLTTRQGKELWLEITSLIESLTGDLSSLEFNIPTEIRLPTLYEIRRSLAADQLGVNYQDNRSTDVTIYVNERVDLQEVAAMLEASIGVSVNRGAARRGAGAPGITIGAFS